MDILKESVSGMELLGVFLSLFVMSNGTLILYARNMHCWLLCLVGKEVSGRSQV